MDQPEMAANSKCNNNSCDKGSSVNLQHCGGCKHVNYCSRDCQTRDWKQHKLFCKHVTTNGASSASLGPNRYYSTIAVNDLKVKALANSMGLALPVFGSWEGGLKMPMRRLVITGKDTPENLALFFGHGDAAMVSQTHGETRIEILLRPPHGSPIYVFYRKYNEGCPPWTPREASEAEAMQLREIRDMQEKIRRYMGSRDLEEITSEDMVQVLTTNFGNRWNEGIQIYRHAINTMFQASLVERAP